MKLLVGLFALAASVTAHTDGDHGSHSSTAPPPATVVTYTVPTSGGMTHRPTQTGCPTVYSTREQCSTCAVPACLAMSTVTQSCGCPSSVPTVFLDFPCISSCAGLGCTTTFSVLTAADFAPCTSTRSITVSSTGPSTSGGGSTASTTASTTGGTNGTLSTSGTSPPATTVPSNSGGRLKPFRLWL